MLELIATCVSATAKEVEAYDLTEKEICLASFRKYMRNEDFTQLSRAFKYETDSRRGLTMRQDWHVRYGRGYFRDELVLCLHHSEIHYFYRANLSVDLEAKPTYIRTEIGKEKLCPKCDEYYPATKEFFFGKRRDSNELESCCKVCYMERKRKYKSAEKTWGLKSHFAAQIGASA